jgi:Lon protease-like protein
MRDPFDIPFDTLPKELIVFPLPGALLLPRGRLPLNIFEPRYLNMVEDALGQQRLIGMVQTRDPHEGLVPEQSDLFDIGCAGRIVSFAETGDGRFMLTLEGVCRFRILSEAEGRRGYRRMNVDFSPFEGDTEDSDWSLDRDSFLPVLRRYLDARGIGIEWKAIEAAPDRLLISSLGMMCPFDLKEKQALIEARNIAEMTDLMRSLMEMGTHGGEQSTVKH